MALTRIRAQQISDIDYKQAVRVITVANVTLSGGAPSTVDGVTLVAGDRILVAGQTTGSQNGLYDVSVLGTGADGTWVRTADGDVTGEIQAGMIVMVTEGTAYRDTQWKLTTNNPIIIGTTSLVFEQNTGYAFGNLYANGTAVLANAASGTVTLTAGDNIAITGNNTSKTVTIGVTGLSLNSIANGTSNVNVVSSGGDVTVGVGGVSNVGVFSPTGLAITGDLSVSGNATLSGNILGDRIVNGTTSIEIQTASGNANISVGGTSNVTVFTTAGQEVAGAVSATGNITGNYILGNGSQLTGLPATYGNANVVANLAALSSNPVSTTGNVTAGNLLTSGIVSATGNITGANIIAGAGTGGNITGANVITANTISSTGNITIAGGTGGNLTGANVVSAITLSASGNAIAGNVTTAGLISAAGNVTGNYILGNGSQLTGLPATYGNANVVANLAALSSNPVSTTGNITAGNLLTSGILSATGNVTGNYFVGNGSTLTNIAGANVTGTVANASYALTANTASSANVVLDAAQPNITSVGVLTSVSVSGNVTGGNILTGGQISAVGNITGGNIITGGGSGGNITGANVITATTVSATGNAIAGNVTTVGQVSATGNVTGNYIIGNGSQLTGLPASYANSNVAVFLADFGANSISTTGNVTAGQFTGNGSLLTAVTGANVTGTVANASYALTANTASSANVVLDAAQPNITSVGTLTSVSVTGNAAAGNLLTAGTVSATGNATAANLLTAGAASAAGNVTGGNVLTGGEVSATGNVTGDYFLGNGSQLTGITSTSTEIINGTSNVSINAANANVTITVAGETDSSVFSPGSLFTGILAVPKTLTGNVVMAANCFGTIINGTVITGNLQIPDGTTVYTWTPS